jgi:lysozyme family protein
LIPSWVWVIMLVAAEPEPQPITPQLCSAPPTLSEYLQGGPVDFETAWRKTMTWEGGDRLHTVAGDPGGTTKYGISQRAHPNVDIESLSERRAQMIAMLSYWNPLNADALPPAIRWDVFDVGFNAGLKRAGKLLQRSVNLCRQSMGSTDFITEDGMIGPVTVQATEGLDQIKLLRVFRAYRADHYLQLAEFGQAKFIHGWLRRAGGDRNG